MRHAPWLLHEPRSVNQIRVWNDHYKVENIQIWPVVYRQATKAVGGFASALGRPFKEIYNVLLKTSCLWHIWRSGDRASW